MDDRYKSFAELAASEDEGRDYERALLRRESDIVIIAPHGGGIEQGTSEIAAAIAGEDFSLYCFNGIKGSGNEDLQITSTRFDEPNGVALIERSRLVVAIHGLQGEDQVVKVGGLDEELTGKLLRALRDAGFKARQDESHHSGTYPSNLCNQGLTGKGVQLEIPTGLRCTMFKALDRKGRRCKTTRFQEFVEVIRDVLLNVD